MDYLFGAITGIVAIVLFVGIFVLFNIHIRDKEEKESEEDRISGVLRIAESDYDESYIFLELYKPLEEVSKKKEVTLEVLKENYDSHK